MLVLGGGRAPRPNIIGPISSVLFAPLFRERIRLVEGQASEGINIVRRERERERERETHRTVVAHPIASGAISSR